MPKRWGLLKLIANLAILCWPATSPSNEAARGMAEPLRRGFRRRTDLGVWTMIRELDPKHIGMCFYISHSTLEGRLSWPVQARLMELFYVAVYLKDFYWRKTRRAGSRWCAHSAKAQCSAASSRI